MSDEQLRVVHLVDDDEAIRRSVGFALKTSGFRVRAYESGVEFLKSASKLEPGCILLDIRMPGMGGLEVQSALRDKGIGLPVIIMTGHGDVSLAVQAMKAGAVDFIEKPFEKAVLLGAIEHGVERLKKSAANVDRADEAAVRLQALTGRERGAFMALVGAGEVDDPAEDDVEMLGRIAVLEHVGSRRETLDGRGGDKNLARAFWQSTEERQVGGSAPQ